MCVYIDLPRLAVVVEGGLFAVVAARNIRRVKRSAAALGWHRTLSVAAAAAAALVGWSRGSRVITGAAAALGWSRAYRVVAATLTHRASCTCKVIYQFTSKEVKVESQHKNMA